MKFTSIVLLAVISPLSIVSSFCPQQTLDFDSLEKGEYVTDQLKSEYGVTIEASAADGRGFTPHGAARIFDTLYPGTNDDNGDPDLGSPNNLCMDIIGYPDWGDRPKPGRGSGGGPNSPYPNCTPLDKVLIIQEGNKTDPDDSAGGGDILFTFESPVDLSAVDILDIDDKKPVKVQVICFGDVVHDFQTPVNLDINGGVYPQLIDVANVKSMKVTFVSSGAVAAVKYTPSKCDPPPVGQHAPLIPFQTDSSAPTEGETASPTTSPTSSPSSIPTTPPASEDQTPPPTSAPIPKPKVTSAPVPVQVLIGATEPPAMILPPIVATHAPTPPTLESDPKAQTSPPTTAPVPVMTPAPTPIITTDTKTVGSGGDPHIKKWDGSRYYYHGECDLVLVKNPTFNKGEGFEIHIRTKIEASYSFIENVAVRVGDSILDVGMKTILIDGKEYGTNNLPVTLKEGYTVEKPYFQPRMKGKFIDVELNNGDFLKITVYKEFISVDVSGLLYDFEHSVGMIGNFHTSQLLGRDGETVYSSKNVNSFGLEWQVTAEDPQLFHETRAPIHPQQCRLPEKKTKSSRKLRGINEDPRKLKAAEDACAHKSPQDFSFCVTDVMVTDDIHMANAW